MTTKLITGKPGEGKTHLAMKMIREAVKEGRPVYTNIDECKLDVFPIPINKDGEQDWTLTQEADAEHGLKGALIVYDEAQRLTDNKDQRYFAWKNREKVSDREVIRELEYHRHSGRDVIFITQSPKLLNLHLLELMNEHYHCTRLRKEKRSQVSLWRTWQEKPDSVSAQERAEDIYFEKFDPEIFKLYKSTEDVTDGKTRIPAYMYRLGAIAIVCLIIVALLFYNIFHRFGSGRRIGQDSIDQTVAAQKALQNKNAPAQTMKTNGATVNLPNTNANANFDPNVECRKGVNVEKPECKIWLDQISKTGQSISQVAPDQQVIPSIQAVSYDPNKPFDTEVHGQYQATAQPVFSGCMKKGGRYVAYTQQGTILHDVSQSDCKKVIDHGDRPFNYFVQQQSKPSSNSSTSDSPTNEFHPKLETVKDGGLF